MVHRAQRPGIGVGGHISSYASAATLYEVGFNHFFRGKDHEGGGDQVFFQGHASPGMYARAFLEGRLTEDQLDGFRQEKSHVVDGEPLALPSYPHPRLMPDFWEFPTVSMGLGPMNAIYQAQFNKYLHNRGIKDTSQQHVWAFLGDGEMDEPESRGLLQLAANEELDNLTFVVNCNLQRLDGPVRGNGKIIQELEAFFRGAGWNVIKVVWGRGWDPLLAADRDGALVNLMNATQRRRLPDLPRQRRRLRPRALLRPRPAHPRDGRGLVRRRRLVEAQARRPRLPQGLRGVPGGHGAHRPADGHPRQDDQGLRPRVALRRPQRHPPDEEVHPRRPQGPARQPAASRSPTSSSRPTPTSRRTTTRATTTRRIQYLRERRAASSVARCRSAGCSTSRSSCPATSAYDGVKRGLRQAADRHDHGVRAAAQGPDARQGVRQAGRADHPRRGAHLRDGLVLPDDQDLQPARAEVHLGRRRADARLQGVRRRGRSSTSASTRPARWRRSPRPARPTRRTASRWCRSTSSTRCSGSSAPATRSGRPPTRWPAASSSAPPPGARP